MSSITTWQHYSISCPAIGPKWSTKTFYRISHTFCLQKHFGYRTPYACATARPFLLFILCLHLHLSYTSSHAQAIPISSMYVASSTNRFHQFPPCIRTVFRIELSFYPSHAEYLSSSPFRVVPFLKNTPHPHSHAVDERHIHIHRQAPNVMRRLRKRKRHILPVVTLLFHAGCWFDSVYHLLRKLTLARRW